MTSVAIVPIKDLRTAKSRLSHALDDSSRSQMVLRLMQSVARSIQRSGAVDELIIVSPDVRVLMAAAALGAFPLQSPLELNQALHQASLLAVERGAGDILVVLGDLPRLAPSDIIGMRRLLDDGPLVLAPDRRSQGTNAVWMSPVGLVPFCFGVGSLAEYCRRAKALNLEVSFYRSPSTEQDVDEPADLAELLGASHAWPGP